MICIPRDSISKIFVICYQQMFNQVHILDTCRQSQNLSGKGGYEWEKQCKQRLAIFLWL